MASSTHKQQRLDSDDDEHNTSTIFFSQETFARYLIIKSKNLEKNNNFTVTFCYRNTIESTAGSVKSVKMLRDKTLHVSTTQLEKLKRTTLKMDTFFGVTVEVTEHKTLNSSKGIIRDKTLRMESEENIL